MAWRIHVADTVTGAVLTEISYTKVTWSDSLDVGKGSTLTVTSPVEAETLPLLRAITRSAWRVSFVAAWDDVAVVAGPLITSKVDAEQTAVEFGCSGPAAILKARLVIASGHELTPDIAGADVNLGPTSLPNLAKLMIEQAVAPDVSATQGVTLPLVLPTGLPTAGDRTRRFKASDLADWSERLTELSKVENGPEVHFRPVIDPDEQAFHWDVRIGTPLLGSTQPWTWTLGGSCVGIGIESDASNESLRTYVAGRVETLVGASGPAPAVQITPVGVWEDLSLLSWKWPLLERADRGTGTGTDDAAPKKVELIAQAREHIRTHWRPVDSWEVQVRADLNPKLGTYALGDNARIVHHGHDWLEDGISTRRILGHSGDDSDTVKLELNDIPGEG